MADKNNAMRMLEARGVTYETYTFPPETHSAEGVAQVVGLPVRSTKPWSWCANRADRCW